MVKTQNFDIWIQAASLFMCKQMTFTKILWKLLKQFVEVAQVENKINHLEKNKIDVDSPKQFIKHTRLN